ncbi:MAG: pyroglutamyl-peptidase I [Dermabacter sp.]|nr:pyroglutamyl-peptidase I [Dermabacter sp.]
MNPRILLTGFHPFDGASINESWEAVLAARDLLCTPTPSGGAELHGAGMSVDVVDVVQLPVEFSTAGDLLTDAIDATGATIVIATGLAAGRTAVGPERVAINIQDARIPDNAGASPIDVPCVTGGPAAYFATLPIKRSTATLVECGIPAAVSNTAGTYVCNDVFYRLMHHLATTGHGEGAARIGGFVHVPAERDLPIATSAQALAQIAQVSADVWSRGIADAAITGGTVA